MNKNLPVFQGVAKPSSDFPAIRSELRAPPNYFELDLSVARSLAAGTAERITRGGNVLYVDQKANAGYAVVHVQDDFSVGNTPITVFPGFLAKVPFTELLIENDAQPGQVMRFIYGTDIDFEPIPGGGVSVLNAINVNDEVSRSAQILNYLAAPQPVGFAANVMLSAANNPRGVRVRGVMTQATAGPGGIVNIEVMAAAVAPVDLQSAQNNAVSIFRFSTNSSATELNQQVDLSRLIPSGWALYCATQVTISNAPAVLCRLSAEVL